MLKNKFFINTLIGLSTLLGTTETQAAADNTCNPCMEYTGCSSSHCFSAYTYFKLGGGVLSADYWKNPAPAIGVGRRYEWNGKAVDISINGSLSENNGHYYSLPKMMYLHYLTPDSNHSPYLAGGLSWGEVTIKHKDRRFQGIFGEFAIGYEFHRLSPIHTFIQLDISQGFIAHNKRGSTPAPAIALTAGAGF